MVTKSYRVPINPAVFQWLRESSGWSQEEVGNLLHVSEEWVSTWENGENSPTFIELKKLSKAFKRPLAAFFLPEPEDEPALPQDFRRLPEDKVPFSKKTLLAIRKAQNLQIISQELLENLDESITSQIIRCTLRDDPENIAQKEREQFDITDVDQTHWKSAYDGFNILRELIEQKNIYVFQFPMDLEELRGFTLINSNPFAIIINSSDIIEARLFTLLHEYAHLLLHEPAFCTPENPIAENVHGAQVERWCNRFAGAFLLPKDNIIHDFSEVGINHYSQIARLYNVSLSTILTRLVSLHLISQKEYQYEIKKLKNKHSEKKEGGGSGETSGMKAKREKGSSFVSLVLENSERGKITHSDALGYLDIKTRHLAELSGPSR